MKSHVYWCCPLLAALIAPFACSSPPTFDAGSDEDSDSGSGSGSASGSDSGSDGGGAPSSSTCETLFPDDCGKACNTDAPCPTGMHCESGACTAVCGPGVSCGLGASCLDDGRCKDIDGPDDCIPQTCTELGFECGTAIDNCGDPRDCEEADGLTCGEGLQCQAVTVDDETTVNKCLAGGLDCEVCEAIPDCSDEDQVTILRGRVVTPGRDDGDTTNQIGVPNAVVYLLRDATPDNLPPMATGIPEGGTSCDRCEDQDLGPVLSSAISDSTGYFEITSGNVPVGRDIVMVVKAGKFRRATVIQVPDACADNDLPEEVASNPARLPRNTTDGLAVNIPHVAVVTGSIDAMECVFHKMGIEATEFTDPDAGGRIHMYRSNGAWPSSAEACAGCAACTNTSCRETACTAVNDACTAADCTDGSSCSTCQAEVLAACGEAIDLLRLIEDDGNVDEYDLSVLDCEGSGWNIDSDGSSQNIREYVNRGGRLFASHLSFKWLRAEKDPDSVPEYDADDPTSTGLGEAATWDPNAVSNINDGTGWISLDRPNASPRIDGFAAWMESEGVTSEAEEYAFQIIQPRSQALTLGETTEEFVHCDDTAGDTGDCEEIRTQQLSFNTPYGAPDGQECGRVAYSGFHVAATSGTLNLGSAVFPDYCTSAATGNNGILTDQEKVLLYMLFDLGACVGDPPPPCMPTECEENACGYHLDGCGGLLDCGTCDGVIK
jgi:hypothetical protein